MAFQRFTFGLAMLLACSALAAAGVLFAGKLDEEFDSPPSYNYAYAVQDVKTGDSKSHVEERDGDVVRGEYSVNDADGFRRVVKYTADKRHGFKAIVQRIPLLPPTALVSAAKAKSTVIKAVPSIAAEVKTLPAVVKANSR